MSKPFRLLLPLLLLPGVAGASLSAAQGPVPYPTQADWESYAGGVTTGGAFADIDGDGHLDLVVANGNDILRQRVEVYLNDGQGGFPTSPQWQSGDVDYHGHLSVGDVDQDGWTDVAVSVFLGAGGFGDKGHVKLYRNNGGTLESLPSWRSNDTFYSFSCDLGDADADGDLDLAVATGEPYTAAPDRERIYFNTGGTLSTNPGWVSTTVEHSMDVSFGDADGDGDLDLAFAGAKSANRIHYQAAGAISTSPGWASTDNSNQFGNTLAFADVDGDGFLELGVSDNDQLSGGAGVFKIYDNAAGSLATTPFWSDFRGFTSAVAFADVHLDGRPDLAGGLWWGGASIYLNDSGAFPSSPDWQSAAGSVVEALFFGDLDEDGLQPAGTESHPAHGGRVFYLDHAPAHAVQAVRVDGQALSRSGYSADLEDGWIALDRTPLVDLEVDYAWSLSLDLGVTNWDQSVGNLVFLREPLVETAAVPTGAVALQRGDLLHLDVTITSSTNRVEMPRVAVVAFPPVGGMRILDLRVETLQPFASLTRPHSFPVPVWLPAGFNGTTRIAAASLIGGHVVASDSFIITLF